MKPASQAKVSLIVALAENRAIGIENRLPWHLPQDLKRFKALTTGHPIIMGRKTFESIGKPLPHRQNIVISRNPEFKAQGIQVASSLEQALQLAGESSSQEIFVIGGAEIYRLALPNAQRLYLTLVHCEVPGDAFFPDWRQSHWKEVEKQSHPAVEGATPSYTYLTLDRLPL